ncbi:MAG: hypothetical protein ACRDHZ_17665 [Ktedonobacteraceae bacterium]
MTVQVKYKLGIRIFTGVLVTLAVAYIAGVYYIVRIASLDFNIVYAVHGDALIPSVFARTYFLHSKKVANEIKHASFPVIPYTAAGIFNATSSSQHEDTFALLNHELALGVDINARLHGFTALSGAVLMNDPVTVQLLLEHGANPDIKNKSGSNGMPDMAKTPLELALDLQEKYPKEDYSIIIKLLCRKTPCSPN